MVYHPNSTCLGLTEQLTQLRIMPYRYETGEMTAVSVCVWRDGPAWKLIVFSIT